MSLANTLWAQAETTLPLMLKAAETAVSTPATVRVVVIDAGHGGKNTGINIPKQGTEKTYVLELSRELKRVLKSQARLDVFLTRKRDMPVSVLERTTLANRKKADVFVSLHLSGDARMHIYINHQVDEKSPGRLYADAVAENTYVIPWDLAQNKQRKKSKRLGKLVAKAWETYAYVSGSNDQKARVELHTAPIAVLTGIRAPAILIELPLPERNTVEAAEEKAGKHVAQTLARGILQFLAEW